MLVKKKMNGIVLIEKGKKMFIILKPDTTIEVWIKRFLKYDIKGIYKRQKNETWVRQFYGHIPQDALDRNVEFFTTGTCIGVDIDVSNFIHFARYLRDRRIVDPRFLHKNQIHVPDNQVHSNVGKELFLDETTNR